MLTYWLLFAVFAVGSTLTVGSVEVNGARSAAVRASGPSFILAVLMIGLLIGFRYKVGADWDNYDFIFKNAGFRTLDSALKVGDPGYQLINWVVYHQRYQIWLVNLACGAIFGWGLWRFCRAAPFPWLAVAVAVPYMVVVVAMGYSRQAVALGILMAGLVTYWRTNSIPKFAVYVAAAALFHRTAVVAFPIVAISTDRNKVINFLLAVFASVLFYDVFLCISMDDYMKHYINRGYSSQGAVVRVGMNLVAALAFWIAGRKLQFSDAERRVWRNFSIAALTLAILLLVSPSSTAVDRMSIYVIPLQVAVLSRMPLSISSPLLGSTAVLMYSAVVEFVWLNFAQFSRYWIPYRFYPFQ